MGKNFRIGKRKIGDGYSPYIIAEAGINHNGDIRLAKEMIAAAKKSGMDAVKFQTFRTEEFIRDRNEMYTYNSQGMTVTESQYDMFKRTEFSDGEWKEIKDFCDRQGITFLSTPASARGALFLAGLGVDAVKVGSDDFTNIPLLQKYAQIGLPLILSCGMAEENEIRETLDAVGSRDGYPVCLMLCTSEYPTPPRDVNASRLLEITEKFPEAVPGFSDHTQGFMAASVAAALGARVFEKHFTLDHNLPGPDQWFSAEPDELEEWGNCIRMACEMAGRRELKPAAYEEKMRNMMRRSITAVKDIKAGEIFSDENLAVLRPGNGIKPGEWENVTGAAAACDICSGKQLEWKDII